MNRKNVKWMILVLMMVIIISGCKETFTSYYPTYKDAKEKGAIRRGGWIPEIIPDSAVEIYLQYNIDTNVTWISFKANRSALQELLNKIKVISRQEIERNFPQRKSPKWWKPKRDFKTSYTVAVYVYSIKMGDGKSVKRKGYFFLDLVNSIGYYCYLGP